MALLTARIAAEHLGIGYSTLKQWIHRGVVRTTRTLGGHHRISDAEVSRLIAERQPDQPSPRPVSAPSAYIVALSGRNRIRGFVDEVRTDGLTGQVRIRVGDQMLTAVITRDAINELKLRRGDDAVAIIKSTEVMVAREAPPPGPDVRPRRQRRKR
jgi:molybdopterin-binding protein